MKRTRASDVLLFFTCADRCDEEFVPLFAYFALASHPRSIVEAGVEDPAAFLSAQRSAMAVLTARFGERRIHVRAARWNDAEGKAIRPGTVKFVETPERSAEFVYIVETNFLLIGQDYFQKNINFMKKTGLPYSNSVRPGTRRMSGLHFARFDSHYPLPALPDLDLAVESPERVLFEIIRRSGTRIQDEIWYRPKRGIQLIETSSGAGDGASTIADPADRSGIGFYAREWQAARGEAPFVALRAALSPRVRTCLDGVDAAADIAPQERPARRPRHVLSPQPDTITCGPLHIGLNNQKMCLVGLIEEAKSRGTRAVLPTTLADFTPRADVRTGAIFPFWDLFDREALHRAGGDHIAESHNNSSSIHAVHLFSRGGVAIKSAKPGCPTAALILGLEAAPPLKAIAEGIAGWLGGQDAVALQLRIERDWRGYLAKKYGEDAEVTRIAFPAYIFSKLRRSLPLPGRRIYVCCDEDDLVVPRAEIRHLGHEYGLDLLFKEDLPAEFSLPPIATQRAMIDFTICRRVGTFVGLDRSSFSRMVKLCGKLSGHAQDIYWYDKPSDVLGRA